MNFLNKTLTFTSGYNADAGMWGTDNFEQVSYPIKFMIGIPDHRYIAWIKSNATIVSVGGWAAENRLKLSVVKDRLEDLYDPNDDLMVHVNEKNEVKVIYRRRAKELSVNTMLYPTNLNQAGTDYVFFDNQNTPYKVTKYRMGAYATINFAEDFMDKPDVPLNLLTIRKYIEYINGVNHFDMYPVQKGQIEKVILPGTNNPPRITERRTALMRTHVAKGLEELSKKEKITEPESQVIEPEDLPLLLQSGEKKFVLSEILKEIPELDDDETCVDVELDIPVAQYNITAIKVMPERRLLIEVKHSYSRDFIIEMFGHDNFTVNLLSV